MMCNQIAMFKQCSGALICINPKHVATIEPHKTFIRICLSHKRDYIDVEGKLSYVIEKLGMQFTIEGYLNNSDETDVAT